MKSKPIALAIGFGLTVVCGGVAASEPVPPPQGDEPPEALVKASAVFSERFSAIKAAKLSLDQLQELPSVELTGSLYVDALQKTSRQNLASIYIGSDRPAPSEKEATVAFPSFTPRPGSFESDAAYQRNRAALSEEQARGTRVVGGGRAPEGSYLWCVAILDEDDATGCSGTLIASRLVLTARHCSSAMPGGPKSVYVGGVVGERSGRKYRVTGQSHFAPRPSPAHPDPDVMLLELETDVEGVSPRAIAPADFVTGDLGYVRVVGFGRDQPPGVDGSSQGRVGVKNVADVPLNGGSAAVLGYDPSFEFCAGVRGLNIDTCQGDSGGAALVYLADRGRWYLYGAVARSVKPQRGDTLRHLCGNGGIYTRVDKFREWIKETATRVGTTLPE